MGMLQKDIRIDTNIISCTGVVLRVQIMVKDFYVGISQVAECTSSINGKWQLDSGKGLK